MEPGTVLEGNVEVAVEVREDLLVGVGGGTDGFTEEQLKLGLEGREGDCSRQGSARVWHGPHLTFREESLTRSSAGSSVCVGDGSNARGHWASLSLPLVTIGCAMWDIVQ